MNFVSRDELAEDNAWCLKLPKEVKLGVKNKMAAKETCHAGQS